MTDQRVFHIDRECYVVYIGATKQDLQPFIRIGNTHAPLDDITGEIRDVVITDRLTGNPVLEADAVEHDVDNEVRYLGDPEIVERFKTYVGHEDLPTEQFETYSSEETPPAAQAFVYFYRDGNMSVYAGRDKVFSLSDREKRDSHYVEQTRRLKSELLKDPLRVQRSDIDGTGVIRCGDMPIFFSGGRLFCTDFPPDSFFRLTEAGIDADLVSLWCVERPDEELVRLFKRARLKKTHLSLVTNDRENVERLAELFSSESGAGSLNVDVYESGDELSIGSLHVTVGESALVVRIEGRFPVGKISIGGQGSPGELSLRSASAPALYRLLESDETKVPLIDSIPYSFADESSLTDRTLSSRYLSSWIPFVRETCDAQLMPLVEQIDQFFANRPQGKSRDQLLKAIEGRLKALPGDLPDSLRVYLFNAAAAANVIVRRAGGDPGRTLLAFRNALERSVSPLPESVSHKAPCRGDVYFSEDTVSVFLKPASPTMSLRNVEYSREVRSAVAQSKLTDSKTFAHDREALRELINALRRKPGGAGAAGRSTAASTGSDRTDSDTSHERPAAADSKKKPDGTASEDSGDADSRTGSSKKGSASDSAGEGTGRPSSTGRARESGSVVGGSASGSGDDSKSTARTLLIAAVILLLLGAVFLISPLGSTARQALFGRSDEIAVGEDVSPADREDPEPVPPTTEPGVDEIEESEVSNDVSDDTDVESPEPSAVDENGAEVDPSVVEQITSQLDDGDLEVVVDRQVAEHLDPLLREAGVFDDIDISISDLIRVTNRIAVDSGFRRMGTAAHLGRNPDWIFPGERLVLPDETLYTVQRNDFMWTVALQAIREDIETRLGVYLELYADVELDELSADAGRQRIDRLLELRDGALSTELAGRFDRAIEIARRAES